MNANEQTVTANSTESYFTSLFYRWFVEYNPLYFASALCFVFGVFLASKGMSQINWLDGQLLLTAVIECYEFLLLAASFFLYRVARLRRPAVILAIINICFLFDCTYQTEHISANPEFGVIASFLWIGAVAVKLITLAWIFRLQVSWIGYAIPVFAAAGIAVGPHLLFYSNISKSLIHLLATWFGVGLVILFCCFRPTVSCSGSTDAHCRYTLGKVWSAAWLIWVGFYLFHIISWIRFFDIAINLANLAPVFAVLPFVSQDEEFAWGGVLLVMLLSLAGPPTYWTAAVLCALVFYWCGAVNRQPRLYVGAIICLHLALRTAGWDAFPFPAPDQWLVVMTGLGLIAIGWAYRLGSAFVVGTFGGIAYWDPPAPRNIMQWGALFIAAGFISLFAGVAANWWFRFVGSDTEKEAPKGG